MSVVITPRLLIQIYTYLWQHINLIYIQANSVSAIVNRLGLLELLRIQISPGSFFLFLKFFFSGKNLQIHPTSLEWIILHF